VLLDRIADPSIRTYTEIVAESAGELFEFSIHFIFISYLKDIAIFISVQLNSPQVEPRFFCFEPFDYSGFERIDVFRGKTDRRASPT